MKGLRSRPALISYLPPLAWCGLTVLFLSYIFLYVDLKPHVDEHFFFSSNDPQLRTDKLISKIFLQTSEIILGAAGDIHSDAYLRKLGDLTDKISAMQEIDSVQSLTKGPRKPEDAPKSPLWSRFLFSKDQKTSFIYVFIKRDASAENAVLKIEKIKQRFDSTDFRLIMSGSPYIIELIQRNLLHDLKVFTVAAFCIFGLLGLLLSRSLAMVTGTLITCTNASGLTLILTHFFHIPVGPLTANLSTIVFVLTLTHMVFMTFNWKHIIQKKETSVEKAWRKAVRVTVLPSSWSMLTALLGFLSLLSVPATPLRQLGIAGAIGTVIAFAAAYVIYPFFLRIQTPRLRAKAKAAHEFTGTVFFKNRHGWVVAVILVASAAASIGLWKLDTKPTLFSYFKKGSELRNNFEYIDQNGGSTPLDIVLENSNGAPFKMKDDYPRLWRLQTTLENDPSVGSIMSLTLLLAEAKRSFLGSLIPIDWLRKLMKSQYYITDDQTKTLLVIKMKESYKQTDHLANIARLKEIIRAQGFKPVMVGGTYELYGKLTKLVTSSIPDGLTVLIFLFMVMGGIISRSLRIIGAMFVSLSIMRVLMLGILGHLRIPLDIISAPGANIATGIDVDAMIHMLIWVKRHPAKDMTAWEAWASVRARLWKPILYSMSIVCAGFGIFMLSGFPPTQRFGFSVVLGTLISPLPALLLLPWFATVHIPKKLRRKR